jgi:hypothetical protein
VQRPKSLKDRFVVGFSFENRFRKINAFHNQLVLVRSSYEALSMTQNEDLEFTKRVESQRELDPEKLKQNASRRLVLASELIAEAALTQVKLQLSVGGDLDQPAKKGR